MQEHHTERSNRAVWGLQIVRHHLQAEKERLRNHGNHRNEERQERKHQQLCKVRFEGKRVMKQKPKVTHTSLQTGKEYQVSRGRKFQATTQCMNRY